MADVFSAEKRSKVMSRIRGENTKPELKIRGALHGLGYRYSLHKKTLPGKPDLYLRKYNAVIEINGCFWHGHNCHMFRVPKTRSEFWKAKIGRNRKRDKKNLKALQGMGIRVIVIWECALRGKFAIDIDRLINSVTDWLHSKNEFKEIRGRVYNKD